VNDLYDAQTLAVMQRILKRDSNCIDVGCHRGDILRAIISVAPDGTHYAFEPIPEMFQALQAEFPNVRVFDLALSDGTAEATFQHVTTNPGYSGLRRRRYDSEVETIREIRVKTASLDRILPKDLPIDFIKVDVEGAELAVFTGAVETIARNRPLIIFEHGLGAADCYGTRPEVVYELLIERAGLHVFLMKDWLAMGGALTRAEFVRQFETGENYYFMAYRELVPPGSS
jgi:FkbM family methyltransferase